MNVLLPFLSFCALNVYFVKLSKKGFGFSVPLAMMFSAMSLFISQFVLKSFIAGFICVFVLVLGGFAFALYEIVLKKDKNFCVNYFSKGFYAFIVIFVFFAITDMGKHFGAFDEFTHWGKMVKEMFRTDRFYSESPLLLAHHDYPPFMQLFEYIWCRLAGSVSEQNMTMSVHIFEFSLIVPFMTEILGDDNKKACRSAGIALGILLFSLLAVNLLDEEKVFDSVYLDILVPMMFCYIIMLADTAKSGDKFNVFALAFSCACFVLVKQISIFFFMLAALFMLITVFEGKDKKRIKHGLLTLAAVLSAAAASLIIWKIYVKKLGITGQFEIGSIPLYIALAKNGWDGTSLMLSTFGRYMRSLFTLGVTNGVLRLSYFGLFVLMPALLYFVCAFFTEKKTFIKYAALFVIGSLGYAAALCVLYMTCFTEAEMSRLASFGRYMGSYFISEVFLIFFIFAKNYSKKAKLHIGKVLTLLVCAGILLFDAADMSFLAPAFFYGEPMEEFRLTAGYIETYAEKGAKVLVIDSNGKEIYYINYYLNYCRPDDNDLCEGLFSKESGDAEFWESVKARISGNEYVYVKETNKNIDKCIGIYTEEGKLQTETLYKVGTAGGKLRLLRCEPLS